MEVFLALGGTELLLYPTATGSEPHDPHLDTRLPWQRVKGRSQGGREGCRTARKSIRCLKRSQGGLEAPLVD